MRSIFGELRHELSQSHQNVTHSYQELRGDIRDLTLRMEVLEQRQHLQDVLHSDLTDLRADVGQMRGAADHFVQYQNQILAAIQRGVQTIEVGIGAILVGLDSRSSFSASTS